MKIKIILFFLIMLVLSGCGDQRKITITSPDGNIELTIISVLDTGNDGWPAFELKTGKKEILLPSFIQLNTGFEFKENDFDVIKVENVFVKNKWLNNFGVRIEIPDNYNQVKIFLENNDLKINLICRAYNEGIAFAYESPKRREEIL